MQMSLQIVKDERENPVAAIRLAGWLQRSNLSFSPSDADRKPICELAQSHKAFSHRQLTNLLFQQLNKPELQRTYWDLKTV